MIFASDLDRTLIYSYRSFDVTQLEVPVRTVEHSSGNELTYMTETSIKLLHEINEKGLFVPVTTRNVDQYKRISLFQEEICPKYVIACNGAVILQNGEVDRTWEQKIKEKEMGSPVSLDEMKRKIERTADSSWLESLRTVDPFFIYLLVKPDNISEIWLTNLSEWARMNGWVLSMQGRKVYIIPSFINKWDAVKYVAEKEEEMEICTAGDSYLDVCMIERADFGLIPRHGEAANTFGHLGLTKSTGVLAAEELLQAMLAKLRQSV
ncbi:HAD family hydrolase [Sporosarcina sp. A2]|uniref:HAD family hydrolase n=1 Tax=Sporosarcina sp. A2 TaxID=3393449 RepID=UPI003D79342C